MPTFDEHSRKQMEEGAPRCRHLRTKALHVYGRETPDAYVTSASSSYQCLKTQFVTGPDGGLCLPEQCNSGRGCFVKG